MFVESQGIHCFWSYVNMRRLGSFTGVCVCVCWGSRLTSPEGVITHGVGNYSTNMQCTWLIDAPFNTSVQLFIERFATECGWDHVYVFDGDNIYSDQLAVYRCS